MSLLQAARAGDLATTNALVAGAGKGEAIASLYAAAGAGHIELIDILVAKMGSRKLYVIHALVPAVQGGHLAVIERLNRAGARQSYDVRGRTAEGEAAAQGSIKLLKAVLLGFSRTGAERPRYLQWDRLRVTPMPAEDEALAAAGDGYHPLLNAIRGGHTAMVELLLEDGGVSSSGVEANLTTLAGRHPVEMAEALGHEAIIALLRAKGGVPLDRGTLSLGDCARFGFVDEFDALLEASTERERRSALSMAAQRGRTTLVHRLASIADPDKLVDALAFAANRGHVGTVRALLALGADPNKFPMLMGVTALGSAASVGRARVCDVLIRAGAKVDKGSKGDRIPPLHSALGGGHVETVKVLLANGASANKVESDGTTTMAAAASSFAADELVPLIKAAGGKADFRKSLVKELKKALKKEKRKAWFPDTTLLDPGPLSSKLGGEPFLPATHPRPTGEAGPLPLALQLDLMAHPEPKERRPVFLQLFYDACANGDARGVVRVLAAEGSHVADGGPSLPPRGIVWGRAKSDFPSLARDPERTEVSLSYDQQAVLRDINLSGDKLGGWPDWLQDARYPECPTCGERCVQLVFQLESGRHIAVDFGDAGVGYVLQCPEHPDTPVFQSQCY